MSCHGASDNILKKKIWILLGCVALGIPRVVVIYLIKVCGAMFLRTLFFSFDACPRRDYRRAHSATSRGRRPQALATLLRSHCGERGIMSAQ